MPEEPGPGRGSTPASEDSVQREGVWALRRSLEAGSGRTLLLHRILWAAPMSPQKLVV